jgi:hypothetical protein
MRDSTWQAVLDAEVKRWAALPWERLASELRDVVAYEVTVNSKHYQVEVELLEETDRYLQVMVAVDDGTLPSSLLPLTQTFMCPKPR